MITLSIKGVDPVKKALKQAPDKARRACAVALTLTAKEIKQAEQAEIKRVFDSPVPYTVNSLQLTPATKDRLSAVVWFKSPDRMGAHYLVPQVAGGQRRLKGYELALGMGRLVPGKGARLTKAGNLSLGQIRQLLSVLGKADKAVGDMQNITARSRKKNIKARDYVVIPRKHGKLYPGVYERVQSKAGFGAKTKRTFADKSKAYQKGRTRGRFSSVIRARGLKPVLIKGRQNKPTAPLLDFYRIARDIRAKRFIPIFNQIFEQYKKS